MQNQTFFMSSEGKSLFDAGRLMRSKSDRELLWGHTSVILISQALAKDGIEKHIDAIRRIRQFRNSTLMYVTEDKASDVLQTSTPLTSITAQLLRGLTIGGEDTALTHEVKLIDVYQEMVNHFRDFNIPAIQIIKDPIMNGKQLLQAKGLYTFRGDRLAGLMDAQETKGFLRAFGKVEGALETLPCGTAKTITFENIRNKSRIKPQLDSNQKPITRIEIYADLNITSMQCSNIEVTPQTIAEWEKQLNHDIAEEVQGFIRYSQDHQVDLLGIGEMIHRKHPKHWKQMKKNWSEIYPSSQFNVEVHSRIDHTNFIL
ncbi:Spore germination protein B3 precursor [compost metagenome]